MRTPTELENRMQNWTPRRPSARLTRAIFGPPLSEDAAGQVAAFGRHWPVIALRQWAGSLAGGAALLVALSAGEVGPGRSRGPEATAFPLLSALSNQQAAAFHAPRRHSEWNHCARPLLEWTNTSRSPSSVPSFSARMAN